MSWLSTLRFSGHPILNELIASRSAAMEENPEDSKPLAPNSVKTLDQQALVKVMVRADWLPN